MTNGTVIRTIILLLALANHLLTSGGYAPLPFSNEQLEQSFADIFTLCAALAAWWKNNSFTKEAIAADKHLHELKKGQVSQ